ncbi:MAG: hypothetical protein K8S94_08925 [Planctomycetia bacterium]|nr:hypothetical protein [Planctomycetia bacterium]
MAVVQAVKSRGNIAGRFLATAVLAWAGIQGPLSAAVPTIENVSLAATYGDGVHAYFAGDYQRSYDDLSQVIEAGTSDPRVYYFRGLVALKLGRLDESEADFVAGADKEAAGTGSWPVARSLERVQGCDRLKLERHRVRARVAVLQDDRRRNQMRYLDVERAEPDVLRRRRPVTEGAVEEENPFATGQSEAERVPSGAALPAEDSAPAAEEMPEPKEEKKADAEPADDGFGAASRPEQADQQVEELAAEREDVAEQRDQQVEQNASEVENTAEQKDAQAEVEAAR